MYSCKFVFASVIEIVTVERVNLLKRVKRKINLLEEGGKQQSQHEDGLNGSPATQNFAGE